MLHFFVQFCRLHMKQANSASVWCELKRGRKLNQDVLGYDLG